MSGEIHTQLEKLEDFDFCKNVFPVHELGLQLVPPPPAAYMSDREIADRVKLSLEANQKIPKEGVIVESHVSAPLSILVSEEALPLCISGFYVTQHTLFDLASLMNGVFTRSPGSMIVLYRTHSTLLPFLIAIFDRNGWNSAPLHTMVAFVSHGNEAVMFNIARSVCIEEVPSYTLQRVARLMAVLARQLWFVVHHNSVEAIDTAIYALYSLWCMHSTVNWNKVCSQVALTVNFETLHILGLGNFLCCQLPSEHTLVNLVWKGMVHV